MKRLIFALPVVAFLFLACTADSVVGPQEEDRVLEPADGQCHPDIQPC